MSAIDRSRGNYGAKFAVGTAALLVAVGAAVVHLYTGLAPALSPARRAELLSGVVTVFLVLVVGVVFLTAAVGREALSALRVLAARARRIEEGEFDVDLETNRNDEFGEVYRALAEMRSGFEGQAQQAERARARDELVERYASEWSARMDAVANGDLSQRLDEDVDDPDLRELATSFNRMMDSLQRQRQRQE